MKPVLVGELNPYGSNPAYALYPYPENSAGGRLCRRVCRMEPREYLSRFERVNLCSAGRWAIGEARFTASGLKVSAAMAGGGLLILLGAKVCGAFGVPFRPFEKQHLLYEARDVFIDYLTFPHPSGRNRMWNAPGSLDAAWRALSDAGALR